MMRSPKPAVYLLALLSAVLLSSCASTGPKISKEELKRKEEEFNIKFLQASEKLLPRIYRVGYDLLRSPVPELGDDQEPKVGFVGTGVTELKDYARKAYGIDKSIKGVLVLGLYPGSKAEGLDLRPGDVITRLDGKKVKNLGKYFKVIRKSDKSSLRAEILRRGQTLELEVPVEQVYYNAHFFLTPTPHFDASSLFSRVDIGLGAMRFCRNDDELAVLMGHELAHTTLKHSSKKVGLGLTTAVAYGAVAGIIDAFLVPGVGTALMSPVQQATDAAVSRRYEREADYHGMLHAFHGGYHVEHGSKVFARLATESPGFSVLAYTFSTHPKSPERFMRLEKVSEDLKSRHPDRFQQGLQNPDWEITIPVQPGESLEEALRRLSEEQREPLAPQAAQPAAA